MNGTRGVIAVYCMYDPLHGGIEGGGDHVMHKTAWWLLIIGGLNWLLVGLFQKDLFSFLGMGMEGAVARLVYILVGLSAVYLLFKK